MFEVLRFDDEIIKFHINLFSQFDHLIITVNDQEDQKKTFKGVTKESLATTPVAYNIDKITELIL